MDYITCLKTNAIILKFHNICIIKELGTDKSLNGNTVSFIQAEPVGIILCNPTKSIHFMSCHTQVN